MIQLQERLEEYGIDANQVNDLFGGGKTIRIPNKVAAKLNYITQKELKSINKDTEFAKELMLIVLSNFSTTWAVSTVHNDPRKKQGYKRLDSRLLEKQVDPTKKGVYKKILTVLINNEVIEKGNNYLVSSKCTEYRLTDRYFGHGIQTHNLQTSDALRLNMKHLSKQLLLATSTIIGRNSLKLYSLVDLPTTAEVKGYLKQAVKENYHNKKGKKLVSKGKNPNRYNSEEYIFTEDYLRLYNDLTESFLMPIVTDKKAGHRVIDSFNMMPSIIRQHLTIDGKKIVENDYSALHPNLANNIYRGTVEEVTHEKVAKYLGISRQEAKIEHLSFFNKRWEDLYISPLFNYYAAKEPEMMENICKDKERNGYKATSMKMFDMETQLMSAAIEKLNSENIDVIYVFDCLYSTEDTAARVKQVMNETAIQFNIKTKA